MATQPNSTITQSPHPSTHPQFVQRRFQEYGVPIARLEAFPALLSYPGAHRPVLQLVDADNTSRVLFAAGLAEPVVAEDVTSDTFWRNHTYLGYSPAGEATAELVYANYGRPEDFDVRVFFLFFFLTIGRKKGRDAPTHPHTEGFKGPK